MIYLTLDDLKTQGFERFINESTADFTQSIDNAEAIAIGLVSGYLKPKYDTDVIFNETSPVHNPVLVDILTILVHCKIHGRNSARKWKDEDEYNRVMQLLKDIQSGRMALDLPKPEDGNQGSDSASIWGNNTNQNFYI